MILAIEGGCDWADASVEYLWVKEDFNCDEARKLYAEFISTFPERWMGFGKWLLSEELATVPDDKNLMVDDWDT